MRTFYLLPIFLISFTTLKSQNHLQYKNIDVGFGGFSVMLKNHEIENESGGLTFNINNEFVINKNLISLNFISLSVQSVKPRPSGRGCKDWCFSTKYLHDS